MISDNFSLEDKLTYEELAPSLQDMFKILNIGTIITDATITASKIRTAEIEGYRYKNILLGII